MSNFMVPFQDAEHPFQSNDDSAAKLVYDGDVTVTAVLTGQAIRAALCSEQ